TSSIGLPALDRISITEADSSCTCCFSTMTVTSCSAFLAWMKNVRSEEHTSELQSRGHLVCRLLLEKKNKSTYSSPALPSSTPAGRRCRCGGAKATNSGDATGDHLACPAQLTLPDTPVARAVLLTPW